MEPTQEIIIEILCTRLHISKEMCHSDYWDAPLTGVHYQLTAVDLIYLLFELEKIYNIRIDEEFLIEYGLNSINLIVNTISKSMTEA